MFYSAVMIVCLVTAPTDCKKVDINVIAGANPASGFVELQTKAGEWIEKNPEYKLFGLVFNKPGHPA